MQTPQDILNYCELLVSDAIVLKNKYIEFHDIPANYACIFSHSEEQYSDLNNLAAQLGPVIKETTMGPIYHVKPFSTKAGPIQLIKIRKPDAAKPQRGYVDFTIADYSSFKEKYLKLPNFTHIVRDYEEMVGIEDPDFDFFVYFANPPVDKQLGLVK